MLTTNFTLAWELDFWGRFRRAIEGSGADLDASVENYDDVLVTLLGDVATNYVQFRVLQKQIELLNENVDCRVNRSRSRTSGSSSATRPNSISPRPKPSSTRPWRKSRRKRSQFGRQPIGSACCSACRRQNWSRGLPNGPFPNAPKEVAAGIPADLFAAPP